MRSTITSIKHLIWCAANSVLLTGLSTTCLAQAKLAPNQLPFNKEQTSINGQLRNERIITNSSTTTSKPSNEIEIKEKRSRYAKHFAQENGNMVVQFGKNYHYKDPSGNWQDIDLTVKKTADAQYPYQNLTNNVKTYFPSDLNAGVKLINEDGQQIEIWKNPKLEIHANGNVNRAQRINQRQIASGSKMVYQNLYPGISEEFEILTGRGVENNIILHNASAFEYVSEGTVRFSQFIPLGNGWKVYNQDGREITNDGNVTAFSIKMPNYENYLHYGRITVFDNNTNKEDALMIHAPQDKWTNEMKQTFTQSVMIAHYDIKFKNGGIEIAYEMPLSWLKQANRAFPITIDPEITFTPVNTINSVYNVINSNWYGYQRIAHLYQQSELNIAGLITSISFNRTSTSGLNTDVPTTMYLKTTTDPALTAAAWNSTTYTGDATQVFDGTFNAGTTTGWKTFNLGTPFNYTGNNLVVMIYDRFGGSGSFKAYAASQSGVAGRTAGVRQDGSDPGDAANLTIQECLAEIKIEYTPDNECATLDPITISATQTAYCPSVPFQITATGVPIAGGITLLWERSTDGGTTWTTMTGTGISLAVNNHTAPGLYRLTATCSYSSQTVVSNELNIGITPANQCYCTPASTNCSWENIANVTVSSINNSSSCSPNGYADYTSTIAPAMIAKETPTPISLSSNETTLGFAVMIDYNQDGVFTTDEISYIGQANYENPTVYGNLIIPATALTGITRMRVRGIYYATQNSFTSSTNPGCAAISTWGETEDYLIDIQNSVPCAGTPVSGTLTTSTTALCALDPISFGFTFENQNSDITYVWQASHDGGTTWTNFGPSTYTSTLATDTITVPTLFQVVTTCTLSSESVTSNQVSVTINDPLDCYCDPAATDCGDGDQISMVLFESISNYSGSTCNAQSYTDYTATVNAPDLVSTLSYNITVSKPQVQYGATVGAWIDFNKNGLFEANEFTFIGSMNAADTSVTGSITIPVDATAGTTRMRVRLFYSFSQVDETYFLNATNPSCNAISSFGETEDYTVNIIPAEDCAGAPAAGVLASSLPSVCVDDNFTVTNSTSNPYVGMSYQWQSSIDGGSTWQNEGGSLLNAGVLTISQEEETMYRLITTCTLSNESVNSNVVTVTMNSYEDCYCTPEIPFDCTEGDLILNVTFESINNTTTCSPNGYGDFTDITAPGVYKGDTYPISVEVGSGFTYESIGVWIDFNKNGIFDSLEGEFFPIGTGSGSVVEGNIIIDPNAVGGLTRMRIVCSASQFPSNLYACGPFNTQNIYGEMEDYLIDIIGMDSLVVATQGDIPAVINLPQGNLQLVSTIYPTTNNQAVTWSIIPVSGAATIAPNGMVTAVTNGTVWGKAVSIEDPTFMDSILITITNQDLAVSKLGEDLFSIYPNPTKDVVTILSAGITGEIEIRVLDIQGKELASKTINATEVNSGFDLPLGTYANGVYIVHVTGEQVNFKRNIIKQ